MRFTSRRSVAETKGFQRGFTLVELLVVVSIVVALASATVVSVAQFAGKGDEGAKASEIKNVQSAMDTMMADKGLTTVTAKAAPATSVNTFATEPAEGPLATYLREPPKYYYCWSTSGLITAQQTASQACP